MKSIGEVRKEGMREKKDCEGFGIWFFILLDKCILFYFE